MPATVDLFFSYSHKDEAFRDELEFHLKLLERTGLIRGWHDRRVGAGEDWRAVANANMDKAHIILLLVSSDFLASDYCYDQEMKRALERHEAGETVVLPIILRDCRWQHAPFARLGTLPRNAKPVTSWANRDEAWTSVVAGIEEAVVRNKNYMEEPQALNSDSMNEGLREQSTTTEMSAPKVDNIEAGKLVKSTAWFNSERFCQAFPGVRDLREFTSVVDILDRLDILLREPLVIHDVSKAPALTVKQCPIWWWRGRTNMPLQRYRRLTDAVILMNDEELRLRRAVAYGSDVYYRCFLYLEFDAMEPTGLYSQDEASISADRERFGFASEEYALFNGRMITRHEYDDGAAIINGRPVDVREKSELRVRYLTPYNRIIASHGSPINSNSFDGVLEDIMRGVLAGESSVENLAKAVSRLPRNHGIDV